MEIHGGLVGRGEQGAWQLAPTESAHHAAGLVGAVPDLYEVMVGLRGEVQELDVSSWEGERGRQCPEGNGPAADVPLPREGISCQSPLIPTTASHPLGVPEHTWELPGRSSLLSAGRTELKGILFIQKERHGAFHSSIQSPFYFTENKIQG